VILSPPGVNVGTADGPNLAMDGQGNAVLAWTGGAVIKAAALDAAGPTFTAVNVPASGTTGQSVPLSASTHDVWSPLGAGQPSWTFGDGTTGAGAAVTHVFARAGTYTVSVGASDSLSNASAPVLRQIVIADGAGPRQQPGPLPKAPGTSVAKPKVTASYKGRKLTGSVELTGTSPLKTTLTITIRKRSAQTDATSIDLAAQAGAWTTTIKLPSNLSPGIYNVFVSGRAIANASTSFTIDAPRWGYLKRAYATGPKRGPAATRLVQTSELWAHFKFANLPKKGQRITTKWTLPNGKKLAANTRPRKSLVEAQVKGLSGKNLPVGRWRCVLRVGGIVVGTLTVRLK
jgi:PKD repeat protein